MIQSEGTLANPAQLLKIAEAVTQNVTVDKGLTNLGNLVTLGSIFASVDLSQVVFATVPNEPYTYDPNKLQVSAEAETFFERLRQDQSLTEPAAPASNQASQEAPAPETTQALNLSVGVLVTDASGLSNRVASFQQKIEEAGFSQVRSESSAQVQAVSSIVYPYGMEAEAQKIADLFGISNLTPSEIYLGINLVLGQDLAETDSLQSAPAAEIAGGASGQTADQVTCQQAFSY